VGNIVDHPIEAHQTQALVESTGCLRCGQRARQTVKEKTQGSNAQTLTSATKRGAVGSVVVGVEASSGFEDLSNGQFGEQTHGEDDPASDLESESAASCIEATGVLEDLQNLLTRDNVFEEEQSVENLVCLSRRQGAFPGFPFRRSLLLLFRLASHRG